MRNSLRLVIPVLVTCLVAAAGLSYTYAVTAPRIAEQDRLAEERSLAAVLPDADAFEPVDDPDALARAQAVADPVVVEGLFEATDAGAPAGWALRVSSRGYGGPMVLVIGLSRSGSVTGVTILSHNETAGLGTKVISERWFLEQFSRLGDGFGNAEVKELDAVAGSTKSSNGVRNGVAASGRVFAEVLSEMGGGSK